MQYNAINLIRRGAESLRQHQDGGSAFALHELANNLLLVMRGQESMEEFMRVYSAQGSEPIDLNAIFPDPAA